MIPEITITCSTGKVFINNVTVEQYKKYAALMEKNGSDKITDALFFNKRIIQEIFGNRMSLDELGEVDVIEFLTASKGIHFIMQDIVSDALLNIVETEPIEREASAFDEYDRENGYEDEEQEEQNTWKICGEIVDRVTKIAIRLMRESYGQCMKENIIELLKYLIENQDIVLTRNQILGHVWGYDFDGETRTVDVHIRTLRQKLGEEGKYIETVRGVGYRIGG